MVCKRLFDRRIVFFHIQVYNLGVLFDLYVIE